MGAKDTDVVRGEELCFLVLLSSNIYGSPRVKHTGKT